MKNRLSNFDIMKILSMLMIILGHILGHGGILKNTTGNLNIFLTFVMIICMVHVNSFILITGYFQHSKDFKLSKFVSLNNAMWFYKIIIMIIFLKLGLTTLSNIEIFKTLMPINYWDYWFIAVYLFLYLSSPLLNIIIKNINQKQHKLIIISMLLVLSILSTFTIQVAYNNSNGYSLANFIMLYFIGAYISKYDIKILEKLKVQQTRIICAFGIVICAYINLSLSLNVNNFNWNNEFLLYIKDIINNAQFSYCNPLIILQSVFYFYFFKTLKIKSKIISIIASTTLGIYLIHDNALMRNYIYTQIFKLPLETIYTKMIIPKIFLYTILIFLIGCIIELIRKKVFKLFFNIKKSKKIRMKVTNFFYKLGINW